MSACWQDSVQDTESKEYKKIINPEHLKTVPTPSGTTTAIGIAISIRGDEYFETDNDSVRPGGRYVIASGEFGRTKELLPELDNTEPFNSWVRTPRFNEETGDDTVILAGGGAMVSGGISWAHQLLVEAVYTEPIPTWVVKPVDDTANIYIGNLLEHISAEPETLINKNINQLEINYSLKIPEKNRIIKYLDTNEFFLQFLEVACELTREKFDDNYELSLVIDDDFEEVDVDEFEFDIYLNLRIIDYPENILDRIDNVNDLIFSKILDPNFDIYLSTDFQEPS